MPSVQRTSPFASTSSRQRGAIRTWLLLAIALAFVSWWFGFWDKAPSKIDAVPVEQRAVIARGSLAEDEQNNIAVFKAASVSTVNITTLETQRGFFRSTRLRCRKEPEPASSGMTRDTS